MQNFFYSIGLWVVSFLKVFPSRFIAAIKKLWFFISGLARRIKALPTSIKSLSILAFSLVFVILGTVLSVKTVTITDENSVQVVHSFSRDPEKILSLYGYQLSEYDEIRAVSAERNENIIIKRAFSVKVSADGETREVFTTGETVSSVLKRTGISLGEEDLINLSTTEYLTDSAEIEIKRVTYATEVLKESIPYQINQRSTPLIKRAGRVVVLTAGQNGTKETTVSRKLIDGQEVERTVINEAITSYPVTQVSLVGAPGTAASNRALPAGITIQNGVPSSYKAVYEGRGTAYSAPNHRWLTLGCVAVNLNLIPRGSILYVTSSDGSFVYGVAVAADTGSSLMAGHTLVDCFFPTYKESLWFGAKQMKVYVLQ
ncbi:MAG: G5 domain-containing protein [Oscillospiraceae bacterium]|nr:G5 domain-containing protein [Oscillospiraceae bacterium]